MTVHLRTCKVCRNLHVTAGAYLIGCRSLRWAGREVEITHKQRHILARLMVAPGVPVSATEMVDWLWGEDPAGGPDYALSCVRAVIRQLRDRMQMAGIPDPIHTRWIFGWSFQSAPAQQEIAA